MMKRLTVMLLLFCSSCVQLGGDSQPLSYYLLQPNEAAQPVNMSSASNVVLEPVQLPTYLDRPQLTTHNNQHQVIVAPLDRWAEPLEENINRVLRENLSRHLQETRVDSAIRTSSSNNLIVNLTVNRFDGILDQQIKVDIRWTLTAGKAPEPLQQGRFKVETPIGAGYSELVRELNSALDSFSYELAQELARQQ